MVDAGAGNFAVGHRRWLLFHRSLEFGFGSTDNTSAMWVIGTFQTPDTVPPFIAYPSPGYFPKPLIYARWSFSIPGADFTNSTIEMKNEQGGSIPLTTEALNNPSSGDNTIVWVPNLGTLPTEDKLFTVKVNNVRIGTDIKNYEYNVLSIEPIHQTIEKNSINAACGQNNGSAKIKYSAGYKTISWSTGATNIDSITNLSPGKYFVTLTNKLNCQIKDSFTITSGSASILGITKTNASCGIANGTATINIIQGGALSDITWSNGATTSVVSGLAPGGISVAAKDSNGCTVTATSEISTSPVATLTLNAINATCGINNGSVSATATNSVSVASYLWSNGATTSGVSNLAPGPISLVAKDINGCTVNAAATITALPIATLALTPINATCGINNGTVSNTATNNVSVASYLWSNGATTSGVSNLAPGAISLVAKDINGCTVNAATTITALPIATLALTPINATCGNNNGTVSTTATNSVGIASYLWSNGATTSGVSNLSPGPISLVAKDINGCSVNAAAAITALPIATIALVPINATCGINNGSVSISLSNGINIASYIWSNGIITSAVTGLGPGPISLIARDINGCTVTASTTINTLPKAVISLSLINATCGMSNGSISINNTNGVPIASYLWSNGATTPAINGLAAGLSSVTATDINGCAVTASANINAIPKDSLVLISSNTTCGKQDGKVMVSVFSGLAATAYQWSNGATSQNLINAPGGSYTITALDKNNCPISGKATIIALTNPTVSLGADIPFQQGKQYVLDATGTGLTYLWSTGATTPTIAATASGNYSVTVMNTLGCKASDTIALTITTATHIVDSKFNITVSPNPTNGRILISAAGRSISTLELIDHLGRRLLLDHNKISDGSSHILHLDKLPSGSYYLRMIGKGWSKTVGVLKQ